MKKRIISLITALALCLTLFPAGALAADTTPSPGPTPNPPAGPSTPLPESEFDKVTQITFKEDYKNSLNKTYDKNPAAEPKPENLIFWVGSTGHSAPTGGTLTAEVTATTWKNESGNPMSSAPTNAGTYKVQATVTLKKEDPTSSGGSSSSSPTSSSSSSSSSSTTSTITTRATETKDKDTEQIPFTIAAKELTPILNSLFDFTKQYNGTTSFTPPANSSPITLDGLVGGDSLEVTAEYSFSNSAVGTGYTVYAERINLVENETSKNYTLTPNKCEKPGVGTVTQAKMDEVLPANKIVLRNRREYTYSFDLSKLLPRLPNGMQYNAAPEKEIRYELGAIKINHESFFNMKDGKPDGAFRIEGGKLYITTRSAALDNPVDNVGTVTIRVITDNFQPFDCEIAMSSANKTQVHITGIDPINPEYNGEEQIGYLGDLGFVLADSTGEVDDLDLTKDDVVFSYKSANRSPIKYGPSEIPPTEPGDYEVTVTIDDDNPDYVAGEFFTFSITRAKVKVVAKERRIQVDDPVPSFSKPQLGVDYEVLGLAEGHELKLPPVMKYATVADSIMEGEFDILIDGAMVPDNTHYDPAIEYIPGKLIVTTLTADQENPFSDVSEYTWYVTAVKYVYNKGMMNGVSSTLFDPMGDLTRAMLVTILYRMDGQRPVWITMPFTDLDPNAYYINAVRWASANGLVNGYGDGRFGPNDPLTREQMAIILYNYTRYRGVTPNKAASLDGFVDARDTSPNGYRALQWAVAEKLVQGTGSTTLSPHDKALRAQVAVVLMRYGTLYPNLVPPEKAPPA